MRPILILLSVMAISMSAIASPLSGKAEPLWPEITPEEAKSGAPAVPSLTPYLPDPEKATGSAIVVCPGGGYGGLALDHEGEQIAQWCISHGIAAFVLQYRHGAENPHPAPLSDAQRAVQTVRARAEEYGIRKDAIGMIGFSAGGHLTATAATQFTAGDEDADDAIARESSRPDFVILMYPVITMTDAHTHVGSRNNLLGKDASAEAIAQMSAEQRVTKETPPAFIVHTSDDEPVPVKNALLFYDALMTHGVEAELHIFEHGRHGLGLGAGAPGYEAWPNLCLAWLKAHGMLHD